MFLHPIRPDGLNWTEYDAGSLVSLYTGNIYQSYRRSAKCGLSESIRHHGNRTLSANHSHRSKLKKREVTSAIKCSTVPCVACVYHSGLYTVLFPWPESDSTWSTSVRRDAAGSTHYTTPSIYRRLCVYEMLTPIPKWIYFRPRKSSILLERTDGFGIPRRLICVIYRNYFHGNDSGLFPVVISTGWSRYTSVNWR